MKSTLSTRLINTLLCALCLSAPLREASAAHYSKLGIITASKQLGRWPALKAWIAEAGYSDEWDAASFLSDDYPQFAAITNSICATGIASSEAIRHETAATTNEVTVTVGPNGEVTEQEGE